MIIWGMITVLTGLLWTESLGTLHGAGEQSSPLYNTDSHYILFSREALLH
jgi:hypothetical protein